jgi:hypothetical protein
MSKNKNRKKSRANRAKARVKAKVKALNLTRLEPNAVVATILVKDIPEKHASTWSRISKFMGWSKSPTRAR